jgi:hypothetical protein
MVLTSINAIQCKLDFSKTKQSDKQCFLPHQMSGEVQEWISARHKSVWKRRVNACFADSRNISWQKASLTIQESFHTNHLILPWTSCSAGLQGGITLLLQMSQPTTNYYESVHYHPLSFSTFFNVSMMLLMSPTAAFLK